MDGETNKLKLIDIIDIIDWIAWIDKDVLLDEKQDGWMDGWMEE